MKNAGVCLKFENELICRTQKIKSEFCVQQKINVLNKTILLIKAV
jgi:hypothetical protein